MSDGELVRGFNELHYSNGGEPMFDKYNGISIVAAGDVTGAVCMMLPESGAIPGESDVKLCQVAAAFLGKQMEE